jgi:hypothetical protein
MRSYCRPAPLEFWLIAFLRPKLHRVLFLCLKISNRSVFKGIRKQKGISSAEDIPFLNDQAWSGLFKGLDIGDHLPDLIFTQD